MLTKRAQVVGNQPLQGLEKSYFVSIIRALSITIRHLFKKKATIKYPEVKRELSVNYRGLHVLKRDEQGRENCTACGLCAVSCPAEAITIVAAERNPDEEHLYREEKYAKKYEINMLRCIFCGLCEEACPSDAIYLTDRLVPVEDNRESFIYGKEQLLEGISKEERVDITGRKKPKNEK